MVYLFISYVVSIIYLSVHISRKGTFYIFSPFVIIYLAFAISDIIPILMSESVNDQPQNILYVTTWATIINIVMIIIFRNDLTKQMKLMPTNINSFYYRKRKLLIFLFLIILIGAGVYTGVTTSIFAGANVEDLRRSSEIGLGFITSIPYFGIFLLLLNHLMESNNKSVIHAAAICFCISIILFFTNAARAEILMGVSVFLIWYNLKYRSLRWYEYYVIFLLISPIVATFLLIFRSGLGSLNLNEIFFAHQNMIYSFNTKNMMSYFDGSNGYLKGMSYLVPMVTFIPRFLWPNKPLSIDYYYKELTGMDFDGGGIYTTISMDMYINFGPYFIIPYILWILFIHYLYRLALSEKKSFSLRISLIYFLTLFIAPGDMISKLELYILLIFICRFYYGKAKII